MAVKKTLFALLLEACEEPVNLRELARNMGWAHPIPSRLKLRQVDVHPRYWADLIKQLPIKASVAKRIILDFYNI